jgi:hypothetical protein
MPTRYDVREVPWHVVFVHLSHQDDAGSDSDGGKTLDQIPDQQQPNSHGRGALIMRIFAPWHPVTGLGRRDHG